MSKLQDIRKLAQEHAVSVSSSPGDWMDYMDTASRLYRYSFSDQLLIHAQRPDATACASLELWNEKMLRWVNRGARGIALFDETWQNTKLRYVFDISDTHMVAGGRSPYLWQMQEHQQRRDPYPSGRSLWSGRKGYSNFTGRIDGGRKGNGRMTIWKNIWMDWNMQWKVLIWKIWMK